MAEGRSAGRTLFEKLWDSHCIETDADGESLLYIDRLWLHERTGSIALAELAARGQSVRRPQHVFCMVDHIVDTRPGRGDATLVPDGEAFIVGLRRGAARFGLRLFDVDDADQGIGHLVSAEQGIALPGLTVVCPDSHTCTLGALGCLAFGIGTSETEHVLATSTLRLGKPAHPAGRHQRRFGSPGDGQGSRALSDRRIRRRGRAGARRWSSAARPSPASTWKRA